MIITHSDAVQAVKAAYASIVSDCRSVLGSELHYQAMVYHNLRSSGIPVSQIGMNVKMWVSDPVTPLFNKLDQKKNSRFQGGFEPIPDVVIFSPDINGDWRRRNRINTLKYALLAIEVKASERHKGRLKEGEIFFDIDKLAAHRHEAVSRQAGFTPFMLIIDTAPDPQERMRSLTIERCKTKALKECVGLMYIGADMDFIMLESCC